MSTRTTRDVIQASRQTILEQIGDPPDLTVARGVGNRGDELIWAGTTELLAERIYREIELPELCAASGHTVLLNGGGAFCRPYHDVMPRALAVAALRFQRVIVLPSSFDPSQDDVREALVRTRATVFAREPESYRRIVSLCDARLAHDCAFFFDFSPWQRNGSGTLNAFRTDREAPAAATLPEGNDDISLTAPDLEQWLARIADHETVRTDRAHVMIAAAMLRKRVEFRPSAYHKVQAIAEYSLSGHRVTMIAPAPAAAPPAAAPPAAAPPAAAPPAAAPRDSPEPLLERANGKRAARAQRPRVTAIILSQDRPQRALTAVDSLRRSSLPSKTLLIDSSSGPDAAAALVEGCAGRDGAHCAAQTGTSVVPAGGGPRSRMRIRSSSCSWTTTPSSRPGRLICWRPSWTDTPVRSRSRRLWRWPTGRSTTRADGCTSAGASLTSACSAPASRSVVRCRRAAPRAGCQAPQPCCAVRCSTSTRSTTG